MHTSCSTIWLLLTFQFSTSHPSLPHLKFQSYQLHLQNSEFLWNFVPPCLCIFSDIGLESVLAIYCCITNPKLSCLNQSCIINTGSAERFSLGVPPVVEVRWRLRPESSDGSFTHGWQLGQDGWTSWSWISISPSLHVTLSGVIWASSHHGHYRTPYVASSFLMKVHSKRPRWN